MLDIARLIKEKKFVQIKRILNELNEFDIAEVLEDLESKELVKIFRLLNKDIAAEVFSYMDTDVQAKLISLLNDTEAVEIINEMAADDATDLIDEMPANVVSRLLSKVDNETRRDINQLLKYPDNSAGSIMTVEYLDFKEENTIKDALRKIRREYDDKETLDTCFVTDKSRKLIGTVTIKDLVINDEDKKISEIMDESIFTVNTHIDQEEVANTMKDYDLTSIAVVDSENKLVGIITIDDIIDIIEQETTEDIEKMAGITPTDKSYLKLSIFEIWKSRIPWLLVLMITAALTGKIIEHYEASLAACVILTSFIPMLMNTGGNAGGQASATIIRSLTLDEVEYKDTLKIVFKELGVALLAGITLAIANFAKLMLLDKAGFEVSLVVSLSLVITVCAAKTIGSTLPIFVKRIGLDPTVMASPFITTLVDAISLFILFNFATIILGI